MDLHGRLDQGTRGLLKAVRELDVSAVVSVATDAVRRGIRPLSSWRMFDLSEDPFSRDSRVTRLERFLRLGYSLNLVVYAEETREEKRLSRLSTAIM